jgi:hypothetical protein
MVHGQLRALGTKQHLKNKFGSGFELVVKLIVKDFERQLDELSKFVNGMFPSAKMISDNGGLITYQIPLEEMKMGLAFTQLENRKAELCIEDYSVAQPTLEQVIRMSTECSLSVYNLTIGHVCRNLQVFIRTVNKHDAVKKASVAQSGPVEEVYVEVNKLGCTRNTTLIMTVVCAFIFVVLWMVGAIGYGRPGPVSAYLYLVGFLFLFTSVVGCNLLCCACCRPATGTDE